MNEPWRGPTSLATTFYYRPIRDLALKIMRTYPPDRYHYVGIGRSPTPIIAMIQALVGDQAATNIPLSDLQYLHPATPTEGRRSEWRERYREEHYTDENLRATEVHIERLLPDRRTPEGSKTFLFLDYALSGSSILNLKREMDGWTDRLSADERRSASYLALAYGPRSLLTEAGIAMMHLRRGRSLWLLDRMVFKHLSEYDRFFKGWKTQRPPRRTLAEKREEFLEDRRQRMPWRSAADRQIKYRIAWRRALARLEAYDTLVRAFARRIADDPIVTRFKAERSPDGLPRPNRVNIICENLLDRAIDGYHFVRNGIWIWR